MLQPFYLAGASIGGRYISYPYSLRKNGSCNFGYIELIYNDRMIVPTFMAPRVRAVRASHSDLREGDILDINLPLADSMSYKKRTADGILKEMFYRRTPNTLSLTTVSKVEDNKDNTFYGNPGLVLDADKKALLMFAVEMDFRERVFTRPIIYVDNRVFSEKNNLIEKSIINKVIPFFTVHKSICYTDDFGQSIDFRKTEIIVRDLSNLVLSVGNPTVYEFTQADINEILCKSANDIVYNMRNMNEY